MGRDGEQVTLRGSQVQHGTKHAPDVLFEKIIESIKSKYIRKLPPDASGRQFTKYTKQLNGDDWLTVKVETLPDDKVVYRTHVMEGKPKWV